VRYSIREALAFTTANGKNRTILIVEAERDAVPRARGTPDFRPPDPGRETFLNPATMQSLRERRENRERPPSLGLAIAAVVLTTGESPSLIIPHVSVMLMSRANVASCQDSVISWSVRAPLF
jgi:hypothetical protein